ncbi:MAG: 2,3-bisphosphoglycerate-independent phosphoglycerate mutase [Desulfonatronovibrio sp.]
MTEPAENPVLLLILDGWGLAPPGRGNAVAQALTPNLDAFLDKYPWTRLNCSGPDVGLPEGQMGNSEVGHLNIGAGRIVFQDIMRINKSIEDHELEKNPVLNTLLNQVDRKNCLHLMGLVSDGGVHSLQKHLHSLIRIAADQGISDICIHCFLDGRDTSPTSGAGFVAELQKYLQELGTGRIATVSGRYYAMDRDKRWDRTGQAYEAMVSGQGPRSSDPVQLIEKSYQNGETDEFVRPHVIVDDQGQPAGLINDRDGVIFFNFRADRARQMTMALISRDFDGFQRLKKPDVHMATMTMYDKNFDIPVLFPPEKMVNILGQVVSDRDLLQLRLAETEKYAHVTYFFNGGEEKPFPGEDRILVPSPREVATYDLKPEMSVYEVAHKLTEKIKEAGHSLYVCNFANLDMVGHTGSIEAAIKAGQAVDECVGRVVRTMLDRGGVVLLTADHGNAEEMLTPDGSPRTSHTLNQVPFCLITRDDSLAPGGLRDQGRLADIAPTILDIWNMAKPGEMTGKSLIAAGE